MAIIRLEPIHIAYADKVAETRQFEVTRLGRKAMHGESTSTTESLARHTLGARCEAAAKLYLSPIKWNALAENLRDLPDLGDFIDVKGVTNPAHRMIVHPEANPRWAFLLVNAADHPLYFMAGWCWGCDAQRSRYWRDPTGNRPAYFIPQADLRPAGELYDIVRQREARK